MDDKADIAVETQLAGTWSSDVRVGESHVMSETDAALVAMGRKPQLKRVHTFWSLMAYQTTILCSWSCNIVMYPYIFTLGGVMSLVWGTIIVSIGQILLMASLAEYCGIWPTAGGQQFYTQMLAPPKARRFLSYVVGWCVLVGEVSTSSSCALNSAEITAAFVEVTHPNVAWKPWMTWLVYSIFLVGPTVSNFSPSFLPRINLFGAAFNISSFFVWAIVFLVLAPKNSAEFVFTKFINTSGWSSAGWVFVLSFYVPIYGLYGTDGVMHLVEEMKHPSRDAPRVIMWSMVWASVTAWISAVIMGFTTAHWTTDLEADNAYLKWFMDVTGSVYGGGVFCSIVMMGLNYLIILNMNAAGSRMAWSMAKDHGFPFSSYFARLSPSLGIPLRAMLAFLAMNLAIGLLVLGSSLAFWAIISGGGIALQIAYCMPIICVVCRGRKILPPRPYFDLGRWGYAVNVLSLSWAVLTLLFYSFPQYMPVVGYIADMNWAAAIIGGVLVLCTVHWLVSGRKKYLKDSNTTLEDHAVVLDHV